MAKVHILQGVASEHFAWQPGQVIEMPDDEAAKWSDGVRGVTADDDAVVHQTYDPAAIPVAEVLLADEPADVPEPHGYFPPSGDEDESESESEDDGDESEGESEGELSTPEGSVPTPETPEKPSSRRRSAKR